MNAIHNKHHSKPVPANAVYIGRPTELGNPYSHLRPKSFSAIYQPSRRCAVVNYALYALSMVQTTPSFKAAILDCKNKDLVCWCAPALCHGVVIRWLANTDESLWNWQNMATALGFTEFDYRLALRHV